MDGSRARHFVAWLSSAIALVGCSSAASPPRDIVLVVIDTLRADRLSAYGYARSTSPRIDALADRGIRFESATSTSSWTVPSHASFFTGLFPIRHGATQEQARLGEQGATLAELLAARGYATLGVSANPLVGQKTGLARGFERFVDSWRARRSPGSRHPNQEAVQQLLAELDPERPFFLFVNYIEPHGPYLPPEPHRSRWLSEPAPAERIESVGRLGAARFYLDRDSISSADLALLGDLYDGEVSWVDALVGDLVDSLEKAGRLDDALLIVTSDHGESLGDHDHYRHVFSLYANAVRIPLIAVLPDGSRAGEVRSEAVSGVDLFRTLLAWAGVDPPEGTSGRDLLSHSLDEDPVFAEYYYPLQALEVFGPDAPKTHGPALAPHLRRQRSVEWEGVRLIWSSDGRRELYDRSRDPDERDDLAGEPHWAERELRLQRLLDDFVEAGGGAKPLPEAAAPGRPFGDLDEEMEARLRELGYLR